MTENQNKLEKISDKLDNLLDSVHDNHIEMLTKIDDHATLDLQRFHEVNMKIREHQQIFSTVSKIIGSGGILAILLTVKELFFK